MLNNVIKKSQREEEQRILYVAMTRAREHLELVGNVSNKTAEKGVFLCESVSYIARANKYSDWLLYGICEKKNDYINISSVKDLTSASFTLYADDESLYPSHWRTEILEYVNGKLTVGSRSLTVNSLLPEASYVSSDDTSDADDDVTLFDRESLMSKMSYVYPYIEQTKINSKLSVTQIKNLFESNDDDYIPDYRTENVRRIAVDGKLSATRVGSLYHFFMQHASLKYPYTNDDFNNDIKRMTEKRLITQKEARIIDRNRILPFFNSQMGQRIATAQMCDREKNFSYLISAKEVYGNVDCDDKILIQGVVDCFFCDDNGKYVIIDYKTDAVAPNEEEILVLRHRKQIELYKRAIEDIGSVKIDECYIFSFVLSKFIPV